MASCTRWIIRCACLCPAAVAPLAAQQPLVRYEPRPYASPVDSAAEWKLTDAVFRQFGHYLDAQEHLARYGRIAPLDPLNSRRVPSISLRSRAAIQDGR